MYMYCVFFLWGRGCQSLVHYTHSSRHMISKLCSLFLPFGTTGNFSVFTASPHHFFGLCFLTHSYTVKPVLSDHSKWTKQRTKRQMVA